jgi:hypothetical protein
MTNHWQHNWNFPSLAKVKTFEIISGAYSRRNLVIQFYPKIFHHSQRW